MKVTQERDQLDVRAPLVVAGVTSVILGLSAVFAVGIRAHADRQLANSETTLPGRAPTVEAQQGTQPAWLYERHGPPDTTRAVPEALRRYGWKNRAEGRVHIPIERAKQLYLEQQRAARAGGR